MPIRSVSQNRTRNRVVVRAASWSSSAPRIARDVARSARHVPGALVDHPRDPRLRLGRRNDAGVVGAAAHRSEAAGARRYVIRARFAGKAALGAYPAERAAVLARAAELAIVAGTVGR